MTKPTSNPEAAARQRAEALARLKERQAKARPLPPGPARDAIIQLARWLARQDHEAEFGPTNPTPLRRRLLTEETEK